MANMIEKAASAFGRKGGASARGKLKRRSKAHYRYLADLKIAAKAKGRELTEAEKKTIKRKAEKACAS